MSKAKNGTVNPHFDYVCTFMKTFSQQINTTPTAPTLKTLKLRHSLIAEEIDELREALEQDDLIEIADALTDILYVTYGAYATLGVRAPVIPSTRVSTNFNTSAIIPRATSSFSVLDTLFREVNGFLDAFKNAWSGVEVTNQSAATNLDCIITSIYDFSYRHNIDINACFEEVQASNMSKACATYDDAQLSIDLRISQGKEDYHGATIHENNGLFLIKRAQDGKVLKGMGYFDPNLEVILIK